MFSSCLVFGYLKLAQIELVGYTDNTGDFTKIKDLDTKKKD